MWAARTRRPIRPRKASPRQPGTSCRSSTATWFRRTDSAHHTDRRPGLASFRRRGRRAASGSLPLRHPGSVQGGESHRDFVLQIAAGHCIPLLRFVASYRDDLEGDQAHPHGGSSLLDPYEPSRQVEDVRHGGRENVFPEFVDKIARPGPNAIGPSVAPNSMMAAGPSRSDASDRTRNEEAVRREGVGLQWVQLRPATGSPRPLTVGATMEVTKASEPST